MEFGLSQEQEMLEQSVGRFLSEHGSLERARAYAESNEARAQDVWSALCELGAPGLLVPEVYGGVDLSLLDAALVSKQLGYHVTPAPFVSTAVMAPLALRLAGSDAQRAEWLPKLAGGSVVAGAAFTEAVGARESGGLRAHGSTLAGKALFVLDFEADVYVAADQNRRLYLVPAESSGVSRRVLKTIDKTRRVGELVLEDVQAELLPGSEDADVCARVIDAGRIALAADTLGAAQHMLIKAVGYSMEREQFGRLIGSFQAVKHMCAEMAAALEPCHAMVWYAAHAFDAIPDESRLTACHTKAHVSEVGTFVAKTATEVHGGIGFTDELGLHYWFKRIGANRQLLGGPERVREEAAAAQGLV